MIDRSAPAQTSSVRVRRAERAAALATTLRRSLDAHDVSHSTAALGIGVPRQRLDEWCDPDVEGQLRASDVPALPPEVARDVLRVLADALGMALVPLPGAVPMSSAKAAARFVREGGDGAATTIEALDDGVMSPDEGREIAKSMDCVIEAAVTLREFAREATKVVPMRRRA